MFIDAIFEIEKGRWDEKASKFVDREITKQTKQIEMEIDLSRGTPILKFNGGPTGFESYYIEDLCYGKHDIRQRAKDSDFCICGGTINRWARCVVPMEKVLEFLQTEGYLK